jgi:predicted alpha-1,2-mannosidase
MKSKNMNSKHSTRAIAAALGLSLALGTLATGAVPLAQAATPLTSYVNTFIGTKDAGNTFPGASMPFGMVQLSPDNGYGMGYEYDNTTMRGFSLTHVTAGCDIGGFFPMLGRVGSRVSNTNYTSSTYYRYYSHNYESASPGYYKVRTGDNSTVTTNPVEVELTATERTGVYRFTFPAATNAAIYLNAGNALSTVRNSSVEIIDDHTIESTVTVHKFCAGDLMDFTVYSRTEFNRPFSLTNSARWVNNTYTTGVGATGIQTSRTGAYLQFDTSGANSKEVVAQSSLSYVDMDGARANLAAEQVSSFDAAVAAADAAWETRLGTIRAQSSDTTRLRTFYSSLYRALLTPSIGSDVDGRYVSYGHPSDIANANPGVVRNVSTDGLDNYYQYFSLWDTYRAQEQLIALVAPHEAVDQVKSLVLAAEQGWAPRWSFGPVESNIMTGDPFTAFVATSWAQGLLNDGNWAERAYWAASGNADFVPPDSSIYNGRAGNPSYLANGFVSLADAGRNKGGDYDPDHSGSATMEYALADATLAKMAYALGHTADGDRYNARGQNYKALFDSSIGTFRTRQSNGSFVSEADPASAPGFHEGTALQYQWLVQQDFPALIELLGGKEATAQKLDDFFAYDQLLADPADTAANVWVTGSYSYYNADKYNPNNEPNLHAPYVYLWTGQPWKINDVVRAALTLFTDAPDGVTGNDDLGTMSAWMVLSSIGLFPVQPGADLWALTVPVFDQVDLLLDQSFYTTSSGTVTISAPGVSDTNHYAAKLRVSGQDWNKGYITGPELANGIVRLDWTLSSTPSDWATGDDAAPGALNPAPAAMDTRITALAASNTITLEPGEQLAVQVNIIAQGDGTINGGFSSPSMVVKGGDWTAVSNTIPAQVGTQVTIGAPVGTSPGSYTVNVTGGGTTVPAITVVVPQHTWLAEYFNDKGIAAGGSDAADFDTLGYYYTTESFTATPTLVQSVEHQLPSDTSLTYTLAPASNTDDDMITATGQTIDTTLGLAGATKISFVGAAHGSAPVSVSFTLTFDDGTTPTVPIVLGDWCQNSVSAGNISLGHVNERGNNTAVASANCDVFATDVVNIPAGKQVVAITFPNNNKVHILAIAADNTPASPTLTSSAAIAGAGAVGDVLSVDTATWAENGVDTAYQWQVDGLNVPGATSRLYTVTAADAGKQITCTVVGTGAGYVPARVTTAAVTAGAAPAAPVLAYVTQPSLFGNARAGDTLEIVPGTYTVSASETVTWLVDGQQVATGSLFTPTAAQAGKTLTAQVTSTAVGGATLQTTILAGTISPVFTQVVTLPAITGSAIAGAVLSVTEGAYTVSGMSYTYQWYSDGQPIPGATGQTLAVTSDLIGHHISVVETATKAGCSPATGTSAETLRVQAKPPTEKVPAKATAGKAFTVSKKLTISGTAKVGKKLTAKYTVKPKAEVVKYQWLRNGKAIAKATKSTYKLTSKDKGKKISVKVTLTKSGYVKKTLTSAKTKAVKK